jgi:hypothetical protein
MKPGRWLPYVINSGFVRVTQAHRALLEAWRDLLRHPAYLRAQKRHLYKRPVHMLGDQDVLTALVASEQFSQIPLMYLRRGRDIVQSVGPAGFALGERLRGLGRDLAPLVHCAGTKPWDLPSVPAQHESLKLRYERAYLETSPYVWAARAYRDQLEEPMAGLDVQTLAARACRWLTHDHPVLQGAAQAAFHTLSRRLKHALGITAWPTAHANTDVVEAPTDQELEAVKLGV